MHDTGSKTIAANTHTSAYIQCDDEGFTQRPDKYTTPLPFDFIHGISANYVHKCHEIQVVLVILTKVL